MVEWMMIYVLESFRCSRIGVSAKKTNTRLALKEVNKHFFDVLTQTHSSSATAAAAGGSQLRWFYNFFCVWKFYRQRPKPIKKNRLSLSLSHTHRHQAHLSEETRQVFFSCHNSWQPEENNTNLIASNFRDNHKTRGRKPFLFQTPDWL